MRWAALFLAVGCQEASWEAVDGSGNPDVDAGPATDVPPEVAPPSADDEQGAAGGGGGGGAPTIGPAGGEWLVDALSTCTFNYLWLKDATGDLNGGPDLGSGYPAIDTIGTDRIEFVEDALGMYSGGGIRGALVIEAMPDGASGATVSGSILGSDVQIELQPLAFGPDAPVLEDAVAQRPPGSGVLRRRGVADLPISWGLMFSPTASAGNPVCAAAADAWWGP